jgi:hypothetical protein
VVVALVQVQRDNVASTARGSPLPIETPFILSPLAASWLGTQRLSELGTKVLGPRSIDYWGRGGGFNCIQIWSEIKGPVHTQSGFGAPKYHDCHYFL